MRKQIIKILYPWVLAFGFDPFVLKRAVKGIRQTYRDYQRLSVQNSQSPQKYKISFSYPVLGDRFETGGLASGHYFHQDLLVAQKIYQRNPIRHVDVASRVDGFVAHVATFRSIEIFDIRPIYVKTTNITFRQFDITNPQEELKSYCDSLFCLHALEHFGLGRYGDPVSVHGHLVAFDNLIKILQPGGYLYLSVPIGPQRIEFNAHRVFAIGTILGLAVDKMELIDFSYVDDQGDLHTQVEIDQNAIDMSLGCAYGCGIFEFRKISAA
jgi:SAM-dependent methyltransferase